MSVPRILDQEYEVTTTTNSVDQLNKQRAIRMATFHHILPSQEPFLRFHTVVVSN